MLTPLNIPAGMYRNGTEYQQTSRWYDANLVRWYGGTIRPVGGWRKASGTQMVGACRAIYPWRENDNEARAAIGTHNHLYIYSAGSIWDITPTGLTGGRIDSIAGYGYGYSTYGGGAYGAAHAPGAVTDATTWSLDSWGEHLVACSTSDGRIYEWANAVLTPAAVIANAPTNCRGVIVTPERHLLVYGAGGDPRSIAWSDSEDNTTWTPTATNSAGSLELSTHGMLITAKRVAGQILLWTEMELFGLNYLGTPYIYGTTKLGSFCGTSSPKAVVEVEGGAVWMAQRGFFNYNGSLAPLKCEVEDYVFGDFNYDQRVKVAGGHNSRFGEVVWFYPSAASSENDRYVVWNYRENTWATGNLGRSCWADSGVYENPLAVSSDGYVYEHECGWTADGAPLTTQRFCRCGPVEIGNGDRVMAVRRVLPDEKTAGQIRFAFKSRFTPEGAESSYGPYTVQPYTDVRFTGRQVALEVQGVADADWRLGTLRLDVVPGSGR